MNEPSENRAQRSDGELLRDLARFVRASPDRDRRFPISDDHLCDYRAGKLDAAATETIEQQLADDSEACRRLARISGVTEPSVPADLRARFDDRYTKSKQTNSDLFRLAAVLLLAVGCVVVLASVRPSGLSPLTAARAPREVDPGAQVLSTTNSSVMRSGPATSPISIRVSAPPRQIETQPRHWAYLLRAAGLFAQRRDAVEIETAGREATFSGDIEDFTGPDPGEYEVLLVAASGRAPRFWLLPKIGLGAKAIHTVRITVDPPD